MTPQRIQRKRTKGWRMPAGAIYVGRPGRWGNPYKAGRDGSAFDCVALYEKLVKSNLFSVLNEFEIRSELGGKDLACWCRLDQPCHADVLLRLANP